MVGSVFISKRCSLARQPPLPTLNFDVNGAMKYVSIQPSYKGIFTGFNVIIRAQDDLISLYTKGYFGKGSLSQNYPSYSRRLQQIVETDESAQTPAEGSGTHTVTMEEAVSSNSSTTQSQNEPLVEELHLLLEESFFLSYALNCLQIYNGDDLFDHNTAWSTFQEVQPKFLERYVAYHHFRAKGWVVRSGVKYGGDYVLYKEGPPFYHATYVVFIVSNDHQDVSFFLACHRAVEVTKKELLICRVKIPESLGEIIDLNHLHECQISEYLLKRWLPSENRNAPSKGNRK